MRERVDRRADRRPASSRACGAVDRAAPRYRQHIHTHTQTHTMTRSRGVTSYYLCVSRASPIHGPIAPAPSPSELAPRPPCDLTRRHVSSWLLVHTVWPSPLTRTQARTKSRLAVRRPPQARAHTRHHSLSLSSLENPLGAATRNRSPAATAAAQPLSRPLAPNTPSPACALTASRRPSTRRPGSTGRHGRPATHTTRPPCRGTPSRRPRQSRATR